MSSLGPAPGDKVTQGFMAAMFAEVKGDDHLAAEILRSIADEVLGEYIKTYMQLNKLQTTQAKKTKKVRKK